MRPKIENIIFAIVWHGARLIGRMPIRMQYCIADFIYLILYRVVRYRLAVVRENLKNSFPEKDKHQLRKIESRFYQHLADVFIETMALAYMDSDELKKRLVYDHIEVMEEHCADRSSIAAMSHYGMWELTVGYKLFTDCPVKAVYHPLTSRVMERFYKKMRSRFGTLPVPMNAITREVVKEQRDGNNCIVALIADQTPPWHVIDRWFMFLNQPTAFFNGIEKMALKYGMSVVFGSIKKVKRGYYKMSFAVIYDGKEKVDPDEITKRYVRSLQDVICEAPEYWMWSHRRWKHKPKKGDLLVDSQEYIV